MNVKDFLKDQVNHELSKKGNPSVKIGESELVVLLQRFASLACEEQREICKQAYYEADEELDLDIVIENAKSPDFWA